jgi:mannose-6-phosphate isomerase-like protein (cupin superfamily)
MTMKVLFLTVSIIALVSCKNTVQKDVAIENESVSQEKTADGKEVASGIDTIDEGGKPWVVDIEKLTVDNINFRTSKWTGKNLQMTAMSIPEGRDIGLEVHTENDQFIRVESGLAKVVMGESKDALTYEKTISDDWAIFIPSGYWHNIINIGKKPLKVYVIYSPPEHEKGTVHKTIEDDDHHH